MTTPTQPATLRSAPSSLVAGNPYPCGPLRIIPTFDRILLRRDDAVSMVGGIILADKAKERPNTAIVLAVGEGRLCTQFSGDFCEHESGQGFQTIKCHVEPLRIKVGQRVLFQSYAGTELKDPNDPINGEGLLLCQEDDIIAIIQEAQNGPQEVAS